MPCQLTQNAKGLLLAMRQDLVDHLARAARGHGHGNFAVIFPRHIYHHADRIAEMEDGVVRRTLSQAEALRTFGISPQT